MAELKLYNTLTRTKEPFVPLDPQNIRMYVCGPTVYDFAHIGNARPVIVFDVLFRLLRHLYGADHVTYARNITDVDDKINKRAFERWDHKSSLTKAIRDLTDGTLEQFHRDVDALGCLRPTFEPRATDFVCNGEKALDMVRVIEKLIANGNAYEAEGHVLFNVPSMAGYGALARRPKDDMIAGARVEVAPYKRDPMDFVLWKPSDPASEPGWDSPWGYGRPGWHIECSAMSGALLGEVFDIHAGGLDLIFPHHENEIAQSCCAFGTPGKPNPLMARYWLHNGFLQVEGQKMSKSLGNFRTIREVLADWPGPVARLAMLRTHYRQPIDWTLSSLEESKRELFEWCRIIRSAFGNSKFANVRRAFEGRKLLENVHLAQGEPELATSKAVIAALCDDLNTSDALTAVRALAKLAANDVGAMASFVMGLEMLGVISPENLRLMSDEMTGKNVGASRMLSAAPLVEQYRLARVNGDQISLELSLSELGKLGLGFQGFELVETASEKADIESDAINTAIEARLAARAAKNWAESDRIRDELAAKGIQLKDGKDANGNAITTWEVKR